MTLRGDEHRNVMLPPAIKHNLLCPCFVTVQRCKPNPQPRGFGNVNVRKVRKRLAAEAPEVINKHRVVGVVFRVGEG